MTEGPPPHAQPAGLAPAEAARRLLADGPNRLPGRHQTPGWQLLVRQLVGFFALMLWAAALLALVGGQPPLAGAIVAVVLLNGGFAFAQEHRAGRALARLADLLPQTVRVRRGGVATAVRADELVRDDIVLLEAGDRIPADVSLLESTGLACDEAALTGESGGAAKAAGDDAFAGTHVIVGDGVAQVTATGPRTRLAGIAALAADARRPKSVLDRELRRLATRISVAAMGVGGAMLGLALAIGEPFADAAIIGIGVTVALVPEALLPTVTLSLAVGAERMAGRRALVRHLDAVETLGSVTFICTDKTGTLTANAMNVVELWTPAGVVRVEGAGYEPVGRISSIRADALPAARALAIAARRASTGRAVPDGPHWRAEGEPMDAAIDALCTRLGVDVLADEAADPERTRFAFEPARLRTSVATASRVVVKGAPDAVVADAPGDPAMVLDAFHAMAARGLRVLAVAARPLAAEDALDDRNALEGGAPVLGLLGLLDPPREGVREALAACRLAGIRVAMITGDHPATGAAVARDLGLALAGSRVVTGVELPADADALGALVDEDGIVIARVAPADKLRIAAALQRRGHVVAMTGDGVNDGPALRQADIGIAMGGSGTDVAREASDLVLLDDHFQTIVEAIALGRATYRNIRRFLTYHLTDNVAELAPFAAWGLSGGRIPLAIGVLQVLAIDIATDTAAALALGAERPARDALTGPPAGGALLDRRVALRAFAVLGPTEALVALAAFAVGLHAGGWGFGDGTPGAAVLAPASGAAFIAIVLGQTTNAFACRSSRLPPWRMNPLSNRFLVVAAALDLAVGFALVAIPPVADVLGGSWPEPAGLAVAALAVPAVLAADWAWKRATARHDRRPTTARAA